MYAEEKYKNGHGLEKSIITHPDALIL
jgi:hypothetical protein